MMDRENIALKIDMIKTNAQILANALEKANDRIDLYANTITNLETKITDLQQSNDDYAKAISELTHRFSKEPPKPLNPDETPWEAKAIDHGQPIIQGRAMPCPEAQPPEQAVDKVIGLMESTLPKPKEDAFPTCTNCGVYNAADAKVCFHCKTDLCANC